MGAYGARLEASSGWSCFRAAIQNKKKECPGTWDDCSKDSKKMNRPPWSTRSQHDLYWITPSYNVLWRQGAEKWLWFVDTTEGYLEGSAEFQNWEWAL